MRVNSSVNRESGWNCLPELTYHLNTCLRHAYMHSSKGMWIENVKFSHLELKQSV